MNCFGDRDLIYTLNWQNRTFEKFNIYIYPTVGSDQQSIIFCPHNNEIYHQVKRLKKEDIDSVAYTSNVDYWRRDQIRDRFEDGDIQFLYATPRMYFTNAYFREFVDEQVQFGNLSCVVFDDAKYLFEYYDDTDNHVGYYNFSDLKDLAPYQRWIVTADGECEGDLDQIADILHLVDPAAIEVGRNWHGLYHKFLFDIGTY